MPNSAASAAAASTERRRQLAPIARAALAALLVAACAPAERESSTVDIRSDQFSKVITLAGPAARSYSGVSVRYLLRSFVTKDAPPRVSHQIFAEFFYTGPVKHYELASDDGAQPLDLLRIEAHTCLQQDCTKSEAIAVDVADETLRRRAQTGYSVKVTARSGDASILTITPLMIAKQLDAVAGVIGGTTSTNEAR